MHPEMMVKLFTALAHPVRYNVILKLEERRYTGVELLRLIKKKNKTKMAKSTLSKHLEILEKADLIRGDKIGNAISYTLDEIGWINAYTFFKKLYSIYKRIDYRKKKE